MKKFISNLILLFASILIGLIIAEIALRFLYTANGNVEFAVFPPNCEMIFKPKAGVMPGVNGDSKFSTNSMGIRGDEFSASQQYRILVLGGSAAECLYLDDSEAWPYILQKRLNDIGTRNAWVGNIGASAMTTRDTIMHLKYLLPRYPKIDAIIVLAGFNDLALALEMGGKYDPYFLSKKGAKKIQMRHAFSVYPSVVVDVNKQWYENTALWKFGGNIKKLFSPRVQDNAGDWYICMRKERKDAEEFLNELPDLTPALEEYERNVNTIIDMAQKSSVRAIFVTQPSMWGKDLSRPEKDMCWFGWSEYRGKFYSLEALSGGLGQYNKKLAEICKLRGVELVDLAGNVPKDTTVFYDDAHFNENGSRLVSDIIFGYLSQKEPFKKSNN